MATEAASKARSGTARHQTAGRRELAALALAKGLSFEEAAAEAKCGLRTLKRWSAEDDDFRRRVSQLRGELVSGAMGRMAGQMSEAADTLGELLGAKNEAVRLGAARSVLELGFRLRESVELEERIRALEGRQTS